MLTGRERNKRRGEQEKFFFQTSDPSSPSLSLLFFPIFPFSLSCSSSSSSTPKRPLFLVLLLHHPVGCSPPSPGEREVGGNKSRAEPIALQRGCRCQRGPPPPSPSTDSSGERPFSKAPLRHCPDRPTPHCQCRFLPSSPARARSWSRYWGEGKKRGCAGWCGLEERGSLSPWLSTPPLPLYFLLFRVGELIIVYERPSFRLYTPSPFCPLFSVARRSLV